MSRPPFKHHESSERSERDSDPFAEDTDTGNGVPPLLAEVTVFVVPGKLDLGEVYERIDSLGGERVLDPDDAGVIVTGLRGVPRLQRVLGANLVSRAVCEWLRAQVEGELAEQEPRAEGRGVFGGGGRSELASGLRGLDVERSSGGAPDG